MNDPVCPRTGGKMHRDTRPMTLRYRAESVTIGMPGWYCNECDESIHTGADLKVSDRALHGVKARVEGLPEPAEIRRIRKRLGLTQAEAGRLIGGGPRAFQKYETGDLLPSRAIASALALLDHDPSGLVVLRARQGTVASPTAPARGIAAPPPGRASRTSARSAPSGTARRAAPGSAAPSVATG